MIISTTAYQDGKGTDRYKAVLGLVTEERRALQRHSEPVYFRSKYRSGGRHGTYWRVVRCRPRPSGGYYYDPRVPAAEQVEALDQQIQESKEETL